MPLPLGLSSTAQVMPMLRSSGAVILGKTVTAECAYQHPARTRNPHDPEHTPGGSSAGSAAAVAAGMVPLALGSQSDGSTIVPAAFCGVHGFKPTYGLIPRGGMMRLARSLDHVGLFARCLDDLALLAEQLGGEHERDPDTRPRARIPFCEIARQGPPLPPTFAFVKTPLWERVDGEAKEAFAQLLEALGERVIELEFPESTRAALEWHATILQAEMAASLDLEWERGREQLSEVLREQLARGRATGALDYQRALARIPLLNEGFAEIFERCDAILTPAAPGAAPRAAGSSGEHPFCALWTLAGMPALSLPLMHGANGLPIGVQLVGARERDARLLRSARWLAAELAATQDGER
jgi:Asp-tRNA(Asn)/Glu-tRNA(Gln) amidotransferase A subunit family amidase